MTTTRSKGIAIIGAGMMGGLHAEAWRRQPGCAVRRVFDPDTDRAKALAAKCGAEWSASAEAAIAAPDVQIVSICTPACFHAPLTLLAAQAGRHILCEKPMALTLTEADAMIAAAAKHHVHLVIGHQYRGIGRYRVVRGLIQDGTMGEPLFVRFSDAREVRPKLAMHRLSMNGGPIHDMSGHFFDLARWYTGREACEVKASGQVLGRGKPRLATVEDFGIDAAEILVRFEGGHTCSVFIHWGLPEGTPAYTKEIVSGPLALARTAGNTVVVHSGTGVRTIDCPPDPVGPTTRIEDLLTSIATGKSPEVDGSVGRAALRITLAALESVTSGQTLDLGCGLVPGA